MSVMGPPSVGDPTAPVRVVPVEPCAKCGRSYDEHQVVVAPRLSYTRCPD